MNRSGAHMRTLLVSVAAAVTLYACVVSPTNLSDGASCTRDDECASKTCFRGACGGRTCNPDAGTGGCATGWTCVAPSGGGGGGFCVFDCNSSAPTPTCEPQCGYCPANRHCAPWDDAQSVCRWGAPVAIAIQGPATIKGGDTVTYTATSASGVTYQSWSWGFAPQGTAPGSAPNLDSGASTVTFQVPGTAGPGFITVSASNDVYDTAEAELAITVTCGGAGDSCTGYGTCCGAGLTCDATTGKCR